MFYKNQGPIYHDCFVWRMSEGSCIFSNWNLIWINLMHNKIFSLFIPHLGHVLQQYSIQRTSEQLNQHPVLINTENLVLTNMMLIIGSGGSVVLSILQNKLHCFFLIFSFGQIVLVAGTSDINCLNNWPNWISLEPDKTVTPVNRSSPSNDQSTCCGC